jgi:ABC-type antimicrobial peptide transport system permease subunit
MSDSLYTKMDRYGLTASGVIQPEGGLAYRIGGTFGTLPYMDNKRLSNTCQLVYIGSCSDENVIDIIVQPKKGAYARVFADLTETMHRINPKPIEQRVINLRESLGTEILLFEVMLRASWILSGICLVICLMGIWSTIALDTRSRQKEVALRKVHGAKRGDIALLFGRLYLWLIGIATMVSAPLIVLFNILLKEWARSSMSTSMAEQLSPTLPILGALLLTALIIILIVGYHLHQVLQVKPAEMIAKE